MDYLIRIKSRLLKMISVVFVGGVMLASIEACDGKTLLVVHNIGAGPKQEDVLFDFTITGHYRYIPKNRLSVPKKETFS